MSPEFLSVTPQRVRCYICGVFSKSPDHWKYRLRLGGHSPVCPSCQGKAEMQIEEMTNDPNLLGAFLLGAIAAVAGSLAWYVLSVGIDHEYVILAIAVGWLVGKAVVVGSGKKRGVALQVVAGALAFIGIMGGRYLFVNHFVSVVVPDRATGWLTFHQFMAINDRLLEYGDGVFDLVCSIVAVCYAAALPRADRLVSKAPTGVRGWRRWVR